MRLDVADNMKKHNGGEAVREAGESESKTTKGIVMGTPWSAVEWLEGWRVRAQHNHNPGIACPGVLTHGTSNSWKAVQLVS